MKKSLLLVLVSWLAISTAQAVPIIACDPNSTGSTQYPNVSCNSSGYLNVNATITSGATTGSAANGAATTGNPVLVGGSTGTNTYTFKVDTSGDLYTNIVGTVSVTPSGNFTVRASLSTLTDASGTITAGGTSQQLMASNASRAYLFIQNLSTGNLYINFTTAASAGAGSILLLPNASYVLEGFFQDTEAVNIYGATTGQAFTAKYK